MANVETNINKQEDIDKKPFLYRIVGDFQIGMEEIRKRQLFAMFLFLEIPAFILFGVSQLKKGSLIFGVSDTLIGIVLILFLVFLKRLQSGICLFRAVIIINTFIVLYWIMTGAEQGNATVWIYPLPSLILFLTNKKEGLFWCLLLIAACLLLFIDPFNTFGTYHYSNSFKTRYVLALLIVTFCTYFYEVIRGLYRVRMIEERKQLAEEKDKLAVAKKDIEGINKQLLEEISDRKSAEDELRIHQDELEASIAERTADLRASNDGLQASENRYKVLADNVRDLIFTMDMKLNYTYFSPSVLQIYGYSVEEALNLKPEAWGTPESLERIRNDYSEWYEQEEQGKLDPKMSVIVELEQYKKDGSMFLAEIKPTFIRDSAGKAIGVLGITRDITDQRKSQELLIQTEKMMSVGGLAAGMAHEINNPLAAILQNIQVIQNRITGNLEKNRHQAKESGTTIESVENYLNRRGIIPMLDIIKTSGMRAANIVKDMLSFSRKSDPIHVQEDINTLLDKTLELASNDYDLAKKFDFRHININREYDPSLPSVLCKPDELQQVFLNILTNGAQAMAESTKDKESLYFTLKTKTETDGISIEIEDNGPGMTEETRKRVFEPFFTTKEIGIGTGLGMSVSYFIITENHGGQIIVESSPMKGARFIIHLPLKAGTPENPGESAYS